MKKWKYCHENETINKHGAGMKNEKTENGYKKRNNGK